MKATKNAIDLIKESEDCILKAYPDPASPRAKKKRETGIDDRKLSGAPWTIGWGSTGPGINEFTEWTQEQADRTLEDQVSTHARILNQILGPHLSQNQFDALVSFCYNVGQSAFRGSTLLKRLNERNYDAAAKEMARWVHAKGDVLQGLVARREKEVALFKSQS